MKSVKHSLLLVAIAIGLITCTSGSSGHDEADADEWKEMDEFHTVMADVFHPLKDSGNLEPIRSRASELAASAERWSGAALPERVDNEDMKDKLEALKNGTRELADQVAAQAADSVVNSQLSALHDMFHSIQEAWYHDKNESPHQH